MKWAHLFHIYQPADQHPGILEKIVNESYRPLIKGFLKIPEARATLNINGVLVEMLFEHGYRDVIDDIKTLIEMGRLELTGSAKYHAFLPLLPEHEVERQIKLNDETLKRYFGDLYQRKGFFSPEMAYSPKVASIVERMGFKWILADEIAIVEPGSTLEDMGNSKMYKVKGSDLNVFFREKKPSNAIMGALVRSANSLDKLMKDRMDDNTYVVTAMDGETFGHHRPGLENLIFDIMASDKFENVLISDLPNYFKEEMEVAPKDSSWSASAQEVAEGNPFNYWFDKENQIHKYEWQLADIAIRVVNDSEYSDAKYPRMLEEQYDWEELTPEQKAGEEKKRQWVQARHLLDRSLNSDPWWWACAKPWWSVEMIEKGMNSLYKVVLQVPDSTSEDRAAAEDLYKKILFTAHDWQRAGMVDKFAQKDSQQRKIPLSKQFAAEGHYKSLLKALKDEELAATQRREYEQAIKWRDAQFKLERDLDIYEAVHIMDVFRAEGDFKNFQKYLEEYRQQYRTLSKGQPE